MITTVDATMACTFVAANGSTLTARPGGLVVGPWLAFSFAGNMPGGAAETSALALTFGLPIITGFAAWRASSHLIEEVIYRRP